MSNSSFLLYTVALCLEKKDTNKQTPPMVKQLINAQKVVVYAL